MQQMLLVRTFEHVEYLGNVGLSGGVDRLVNQLPNPGEQFGFQSVQFGKNARHQVVKIVVNVDLVFVIKNVGVIDLGVGVEFGKDWIRRANFASVELMTLSVKPSELVAAALAPGVCTVSFGLLSEQRLITLDRMSRLLSSTAVAEKWNRKNANMILQK